MSTTHIKKIAGTRQAIDYQLYGSKYTDAYRNNKRNGTDRVAALSMDAGSTDEFIDRSQALAEVHGRKVEALSLIQSFEKTEMNPDDPEDVQRVNQLGYALAKKMYPNSDCHVVTHIDGRGGHPHNHIIVINHDNVTGRAIKSNTRHWQVARHNDELMRDNGLSVVTPEASKDRARYWELERDSSSVTEFERQLGDTIQEVLDDPAVIDIDEFKSALADRGVEVVEKSYKIEASADGTQPEHESIGWTYKMLDETGNKPRTRRRKASSLSDDLTRNGVERTLEEKIDERAIGLGVSATEERGEDAAALAEIGITERASDAMKRKTGVDVDEQSQEPQEVPADTGEAARRHRDKTDREDDEDQEQKAPAEQPTAPTEPQQTVPDPGGQVRAVLRRVSDKRVRAAQQTRTWRSDPEPTSAHRAAKVRLRELAESGELIEQMKTMPPDKIYRISISEWGEANDSPQLGQSAQRKLDSMWRDTGNDMLAGAKEKKREWMAPRYAGPDTKAPKQLTAAERKHRDLIGAVKDQKAVGKDNGRDITG